MYTLILFIYAGVFAKGDSVALDHVEGFTSKEACVAAAQEAKKFVDGTAKEFRFVCVKK